MKHNLILLTFVFVGLLLAVSVALAAEKPITCQSDMPCQDVQGVSEAEIAAYPKPVVGDLFVNRKLLHDRWYVRVDGKLDVYDAPNGNVIRSLDPGFNFLTILNMSDGWAEINAGEWVKTGQLKEVNSGISQFSGALLPDEPLPYTMAWVLVNLYPSTYPGGTPNETVNDLVRRYTRVNIYATVEVEGWRWYQIGVNQWVNQKHVAKSIPVARPEGVTTENWISIDLYEQVIVAYEGDTPVFTTLISSGLPRWPTHEGVFNIYWRRYREDMTWGVVGDDFYYLEEVPWTMFFDEGRALHGAYWHDGLGYRRSHGCVNMSITDARWLYDWVAEYMGTRLSANREEGPNVYIYSSGVYVTN